jgi:deoxyadenosine/deoxycytidine kinase
MIVIGGMVGLGKTTAAKIIADELAIPAYYESVKDNKILPLFYTATPEETQKYRYPFLLQLAFLQTRMKEIKGMLSCPNAVMDRSIYEDRYFAQKIHDEGRISDLELDVYNGLFQEMMAEIPGTPSKKPDVMIYLKGSWETVLARLKKRGRSYELNQPSLDHLHYLWEGYDQWFYSSYKESPVIEIDTEKRDLAEKKEDREWLLAQLKAICANPHPFAK